MHIPGLPDHIALDCIARVPHCFLPGLRLIYQHWRDLVTARSFRHHRERICSTEHLIFIIQVLGGTATFIAATPSISALVLLSRHVLQHEIPGRSTQIPNRHGQTFHGKWDISGIPSRTPNYSAHRSHDPSPMQGRGYQKQERHGQTVTYEVRDWLRKVVAINENFTGFELNLHVGPSLHLPANTFEPCGEHQLLLRSSVLGKLGDT
ncbi:hypothetical protein M5K25_004422 [Dendrobium thyrsiflorum]|uniref:Uncharacterized protein n=1 Tax=Dendrobium thyrsiflorum TaxID=117978 RepID=A0ABD0VMM0_DENTH